MCGLKENKSLRFLVILLLQLFQKKQAITFLQCLMRISLPELKLVIIDEVSVISNITLLPINQRLKGIFGAYASQLLAVLSEVLCQAGCRQDPGNPLQDPRWEYWDPALGLKYTA